jgi:hypothetical protein
MSHHNREDSDGMPRRIRRWRSSADIALGTCVRTISDGRIGVVTHKTGDLSMVYVIFNDEVIDEKVNVTDITLA